MIKRVENRYIFKFIRGVIPFTKPYFYHFSRNSLLFSHYIGQSTPKPIINQIILLKLCPSKINQ